MKGAVRAALGVSLLAAASVCGSCGGGSGPTAPSPTASVPGPAGGVCGVIAGANQVSLGIVNGTVCSSANTPVVLLNLRDKDGGPSGACSGTVIAPRAVLTAAHCLVGDTAAVRVYRGSGDQVAAASFHANPRYRANDSSALDVGVILTEQDLDRPIVPLLVSRDAQVGEQAVIAGWGKDEFGTGTTLRAGTTSILVVGAVFLQTQHTSGTSGVCSGDSGGPLLLSEGGVWAVAGVTSGTDTGAFCTEGVNYFANVRNPDITAFILGLAPNASRR